MSSSYVNLVSNINWTVFWVMVIAFVGIKEKMSRSRQTHSQVPLWKELATTTAPALVLAMVVLVPLQAVWPTVLPATGVSASVAPRTAEGITNADDLSLATLQAQGETIFRTKGCLGCHTIQGVSEIGTFGPELTHIASKEKIADQVPYSPENLRNWLLNPHELKPGTQMPNMNLTPQELDAIVAYLDSLK